MPHYLTDPFSAAPEQAETVSNTAGVPDTEHVSVNGMVIPAQWDTEYTLAVTAALSKGWLLWIQPEERSA